jgi:hypothetical protein
MKTTKQILAVLSGMAMLAVVIFSAVITSKMRYILADLGDVAVPVPSQAFLSIPAWAFICIGIACAVGVGFFIWRLRHSWLAVPAFLVTLVICFLYLGVLSVNLRAAIGGLIVE